MKENESPLWAIIQKTAGLGGRQQQQLLYLGLLFLSCDRGEGMIPCLVNKSKKSVSTIPRGHCRGWRQFPSQCRGAGTASCHLTWLPARPALPPSPGPASLSSSSWGQGGGASQLLRYPSLHAVPLWQQSSQGLSHTGPFGALSSQCCGLAPALHPWGSPTTARRHGTAESHDASPEVLIGDKMRPGSNAWASPYGYQIWTPSSERIPCELVPVFPAWQYGYLRVQHMLVSHFHYFSLLSVF